MANQSQNPYESPTDDAEGTTQSNAVSKTFLAKAVTIAGALLGILVVLAVVVPFIAGMISGLLWHFRN